jgi:hypothetical protein
LQTHISGLKVSTEYKFAECRLPTVDQAVVEKGETVFYNLQGVFLTRHICALPPQRVWSKTNTHRRPYNTTHFLMCERCDQKTSFCSHDTIEITTVIFLSRFSTIFHRVLSRRTIKDQIYVRVARQFRLAYWRAGLVLEEILSISF